MEPHLGRQRIALDDRVDAVARVPGVEVDVEKRSDPPSAQSKICSTRPGRVLLAEEATAGVALHLLDRERRRVLWLLEGP